MLKAIGILMLITATTVTGLIFSKRLSDRVHMLELIRQMTEEISIQLRFQAATVYEILNMIDLNPSFEEIGFIHMANEERTLSKSFSELWCEKLDNWRCPCLKKEDYAVIRSIGNNLGTSDIEGQLSSIELHKEKIRMNYDSAIAERDKKAKLYRTLGILSGIFVSVIIV